MRNDRRVPSPMLDVSELSVRCPRCGGRPHGPDGEFVCPACGARGRANANIVDWRSASAGDRPREARRLWRSDLTRAGNLRRLDRAFRYFLHPVSSPLSPLAWLTRARLRRYYERTRCDPDMAQRWAEHYLGGLPRHPEMHVLDHGTGRGRNVGILSQLGFQVAAQDIAPDGWWSNFPECRFQIVPPECGYLPWPGGAFDLVLDWMVVEYLQPEKLAQLAREIPRVLKPDGHWLVLTPNAESLGARVPRRFAGRLYSLETVERIAAENGMTMVHPSYEGFSAPVAPVLFDAIRKTCAPWPLDLADYDSALARLLAPRRRALWLAAFRKA